MRRRAWVHQAMLQQAYPGSAWNPDRLTPKERAILSELDAPHGRFAGWESGTQSAGDFAAAQARAQRRVGAAAQGLAQRPRRYRAPEAPAAQPAAPPSPSQALPAKPVGARPIHIVPPKVPQKDSHFVTRAGMGPNTPPRTDPKDDT